MRTIEEINALLLLEGYMLHMEPECGDSTTHLWLTVVHKDEYKHWKNYANPNRAQCKSYNETYCTNKSRVQCANNIFDAWVAGTRTDAMPIRHPRKHRTYDM